MHAKGLFFEN